MDVWRVLVVEDNPEMRVFFSDCIARSPALALAGSVGTVAQAKSWLNFNALSLNVLLVDLGLPDGSGLDVIRHAIKCNPACEVLVISMFGDEDNVLASIEAGALGYIHKDSAPEDVAQTIIDMRAGASPISPMIARRVLAKYRSLGQKTPPAQPQQPGTTAARGPQPLPAEGFLSTREQQVLALVARGFSHAEIARLQELSVHTVHTHIKNLYAKLSVHSKTEAIYEATRMGLLTDRD